MNFIIAIFIQIFSLLIGVMAVIVGKPFIKTKTNKKLPLYICNIACVVGLIVFISLLFSMTKGEHLNSATTFTEYPIEKVTFNHVYFNDRSDSFNDSYVILEESKNEYQNVVIVENKDYEVQWLFCKIKYSVENHHVYLANDIYERLKNGAVIYERN